jgi:mono/diheme cytochrome c family protein
MNKATLRGAALAATFIGVCLVCLPGLAARSANDNKKAATQGRRAAAAIYAKSCATCHGKDGRAKTFKAKFNDARDLTDATWQADVSDERLYNSISNGRGKMPAFGKKLSEAEINGLVAHVRGLKR